MARPQHSLRSRLRVSSLINDNHCVNSVTGEKNSIHVTGHIPIHSQSRKYMRFHLQGRSYQFKALPFGLSTAPMEFTVVAKEVKLMALQKGIRIHQYLDDWLVRASTHDACLQHTQTLVNLRLPVRPKRGQGQIHNRTLADLDRQDQVNTVGSGLPGPTVHVPHRSTHSNSKTSPPRATSHEARTVALEKQLEDPRVTREGDPGSQVPPPPSDVVPGGKQCATRSRTRVAGEQGKVRTGSQTSFQLRRLPVRPKRGQGQTQNRTLADLHRQDQVNTVGSGLPGPTVHVPHRSTHSNSKTSPPRATSHEAHTVALEKQLEDPRVTREGDPGPSTPI